MADDAGVVVGYGAGQSGGLHRMVVRGVQQSVQDVTSVLSGLVGSLGQVEGDQKVHYSGYGWILRVVIMDVKIFKEEERAM